MNTFISNKKYLVEALGTFTLAVAIGGSLITSVKVATPVLAGLVLLLFVNTIGPISGAHINPGVTIGAWSIGKINKKGAVAYIISQFIGAALALLTMRLLSGPLPNITTTGGIGIGIAEMIGMTLFTFGIASVMYGQTSKNNSGVVIGGSLVVGIAIAAGLGSNGVLNPAVALGIGSFGIWYILGPILGGVMGMWLYRACCQSQEK